jgi:IS1 family transposase
MARTIKNVPVDDVQADEIWQFIYCKQYTARQEKYVGGCGDSYCYTAVERNTKLLVAWHMGRRNEPDTHEFCRKLNEATTGRFQLSTDGWAPYPFAVKRQIGSRVDHGVLVKIFREPEKEDRRRYSPSKIIGSKKVVASGNPDMNRVCTSHSERHNGSIRNFCKRMGRLTYCFSKRWENHQAALGLFFAHYNFCRKHRTLGYITPAMAHGLENHVWTVRELLEKIMGDESATQ